MSDVREDLVPIMASAAERRAQIRQKVLEGLRTSFPIQSRSKQLEVDSLQYDEKDYSPAEQKEAILKGHTLYETVKGTIRMKDAQGETIDEVKNFTIARIPWFTPRHTMVVDGNEYSIANQLRAKPGVYGRKRRNGVLEASFNTRGGSNFNVTLDPAKGEPQLEYGTSKIPLYPVLRGAGVNHDQIAKVWGRQLADENEKQTIPKREKTIDRLYKKVVPKYRQRSSASSKEQLQEVFSRYANSKMDPEVNRQTLGHGYSSVTPESLLDASGKVLKIFKNPAETDDRDNLDFKALHSADDFLKEVITLDARDVARKAAIKMEQAPSLRKAIPSGPFTRGILRFINTSQLVSVPTQTNPMELIDSSMRVTSMGEGGIKSDRAIPDEARHVHVTQMGALDPFRTPESFRAGVDIRAAMGVKKDRKGNIYIPLKDVKSGKHRYVRAGAMKDEVVAFPGQKLTGQVDALVNGEIRRVSASRVKYQAPPASLMYSPTTNMVPFIESMQGNRAVMGSKMQVQALSLTDREEPWVQTKSPTGESFEHHMATMINPLAPVAGTVAKVDENYVYIRPDGEKTGAKGDNLVKVPYETNFPLAAKTHLTHALGVKKGDRVREGQQLGESNFTRNGKLALGKNLRVAYMPYYGANSNDAVVISEGAAKKLTSERMYTVKLPVDADTRLDRERHRAYYGQGYKKDQYRTLDKAGLVKPGTIIQPNDPVILGLRKTQLSSDDVLLGRLHRSLAKPFKEAATRWDHETPGEVIDVVRTPKRVAITIKTKEPMIVGDKISGRFGNKGVIAQIVPNAKMIQDENEKPVDVIMTSAGVVSRTNPSQIIETAVGKVAEKTGKPILVENLSGRNNVEWAKALLKKHGVKDKETVLDPVSGKKIPGVFVGRQFIMKLMKSTDTNYSARGLGNYDINLMPTKGGVHSAKALGKMEFDALVGHNARNVIREAAVLKSQKNDEYWRAVQLGYPTPPPKTSFAYDKFLNMLTGAGVRVHREGNRMSLLPLTDKDTLEMSAGEVRKAALIKAKGLKPEAEGLFDPAITGGLTGTKWSHIDLAEPVVSPTFREPVKRLLGMTGPQLDAILKEKGGRHIQRQLAAIDLDKRKRALKRTMSKRSASTLDGEVKQLKYINALQAQGLTPDKAYVISKVPVIPPTYRPVLPGRSGGDIIYGDVNPLYRDLLMTNNQLKNVKKSSVLKGEEERLRPTLNAAVGAVYGTNPPITAKSQARGHKGFLTHISGVNSPKQGYFHSKLMSKTQDMAGRGTAVPDNTLGLDEVGVPETMLWTMYDKFLIKGLVRNGYTALQAAEMVKDKHPAAKTVLLREIKERPLMVNRAPTLHRYNIVGAFPVPVPGKTIRVNPFIENLQNLDYDGDSYDGNVLTSIDGRVTLSHIRDFPRKKETKMVKGNKETYDVPNNVRIHGFSEKNQRVELLPVLKFSVHHDLEMVVAKTVSKREVKVSRDHSLFGLNPSTGKLERFRAEDGVGWGVVRPKRIQPSGSLKKILVDSLDDGVELTEELGWAVGAWLGDGSKTNRSIQLATTHQSIRDRFTASMQTLFPDIRPRIHDNPHTFKGYDCFSSKAHYNSVKLAPIFNQILQQESTGIASTKHLPAYFIDASVEFLQGLLSGLLDTDGTVTKVKAKAKTKPQVMVHYDTSSERLAYEVSLLSILLGIRSGITEHIRKDTGKTTFTLHFSLLDISENRDKISCVREDKKTLLDEVAKDRDRLRTGTAIQRLDMVPVAKGTVQELRLIYSATTLARSKQSSKEKKARDSLRATLYKSCQTGRLSRVALNRAVNTLGSGIVRDLGGADWFNNVTNKSIQWDFIESVEPIEGRHTAWDLTVPDGNTFMTANQLIVFDTLMLHAPIGKEAIEEVKGMTLSNLLYSDKSKKDLLVFPQHEAIMGIAHASQMDDKNKPLKFKNRAEAKKAYQAGKIGLGTRVKIDED